MNTIEPLESRIAPAGFVYGYTDVDGDRVSLAVSKGTLADVTFATVARGFGEQLVFFDLQGKQLFKGANLTLTATPQLINGEMHGDGLVNLGRLNATGIDLGTVKIAGDLGAIDAGDADTTATSPALKMLSVNSLGRFGLTTGVTDLVSDLIGMVGALKVTTDLKDAYFHVTDGGSGANGKLGSVTIGGSIVGGISDYSGLIQVTSDIGAVKVGGDIRGGPGSASGLIQSDFGKIKSVTVGGSLVGWANSYTGEIRSGSDMGPVMIGGDVIGGSAFDSGIIATDTGFGVDNGKLAKVVIRGSLRGGSGQESGIIRSSADIGSIDIKGSVLGAAGMNSGVIDSDGNIGVVKIGGDLRGGGPTSGIIQGLMATTVGGITIGGSIVGGSGAESGKIVAQSAVIPFVKIGGGIIGGTAQDTAKVLVHRVGNLSVGGDVHGGSAVSTALIIIGQVDSATIGGSVIGADFGNTAVVGIPIVKTLKIMGDLRGGNVTGSAGVNRTGLIDSVNLGNLTIGGSIISGRETGTGTLQDSGSIRVKDDIGSLTVQSSLDGAQALDAVPVIITAQGDGFSSTAINDVAIGKITVKGRVEHAEILAGYDDSATPAAVNADAQIGSVMIGGQWIASDLIAGVQAGGDGFGNANDTKASGGAVKDNADADGAISRIASVIIKGGAIGTASNTDSLFFGIEAQHLGSIKIGNATVPLVPDAGNDLFAQRHPLAPTFGTGGLFDFNAFEVL